MNKYGPKARRTIEQSMDQFKKGKLRSSRSNKKDTGQNRSIHIGVSETRQKGFKVPEVD